MCLWSVLRWGSVLGCGSVKVWRCWCGVCVCVLEVFKELLEGWLGILRVFVSFEVLRC
jgi:hypothetical protein